MDTFQLKIVTPDGPYFDGEAQRVRLRTIEGDVAVMAHHIPYVTAIGIGECRLVLPDGSERSAACCGGLLSFSESGARVIATTFEWAEEIDVERAQAARTRAESRLETAADAAERADLTQRLRRAETRLRVAAMNPAAR